ncbi:hypothetical protein J2T57_002599 [Natronocella acetinitrilica]|uniref:Uncharacterized protein n=1 Tax=Natronocella acetinitrilica TaxID=414046 RepID=A0AAE3G5K5_9GAMM|nr:hypothetical protein [Natronocella acetinitrilica]MCP1675449.1 hypothetical protein [Natronocella acetinitrilica]
MQAALDRTNRATLRRFGVPVTVYTTAGTLELLGIVDDSAEGGTLQRGVPVKRGSVSVWFAADHLPEGELPRGTRLLVEGKTREVTGPPETDGGMVGHPVREVRE